MTIYQCNNVILLSIIILNYNTKDQVKQCVRNIRQNPPSVQYEIIIVDNGSTDGSLEFIKYELSDVKIVVSDKNLGYGRGNNLGIKSAQAEYILILNPDIVVKPRSIDILYKFIKSHQQVGIIGPKLFNPDGTVQYSCFRWPHFLTPLARRTPLSQTNWGKSELIRYFMLDYNHNASRAVNWLLGAALMIKRKALDKVSGFDKRYFLYCEDIDLCRQIQEKGWEIWYNPEAEMIHYHKRLSDKGHWLLSLLDRTTRIHLGSHIKYFWKWRNCKS